MLFQLSKKIDSLQFAHINTHNYKALYGTSRKDICSKPDSIIKKYLYIEEGRFVIMHSFIALVTQSSGQRGMVINSMLDSLPNEYYHLLFKIYNYLPNKSVDKLSLIYWTGRDTTGTAITFQNDQVKIEHSSIYSYTNGFRPYRSVPKATFEEWLQERQQYIKHSIGYQNYIYMSFSKTDKLILERCLIFGGMFF